MESSRLTHVFAILACLLSLVQAVSVRNRSEIGEPHIIGGVTAGSKESPYVAQLRLQKNDKVVRYCGAARLNKQWFLTAAECLDQTKYDYVRISYPANLWGEVDFDFVDSTIAKLKYKVHPQYNPKWKTNNLAIIRCDFCLRADFSRLADLPLKNVSGALSGQGAVVSSWGVVPKNSSKGVINQLDSYVLHPIVCNLLHLFMLSDDKLICTSGTADKGATEDDVGAPLLLRSGVRGLNFTLIGIGTSYRPWSIYSRPMIFTKVYPYMEWIYQETGINPAE